MTNNNNKDEKKAKSDELEQKIEEAQKQDDQKNAEDVATEIDDKEAKIEELTAALARCMADMQNFKRRTEEEQGRFVKFANTELLKQLLPIIDNFDRSTEHLPDDLKSNEWASGIVIIHDDLLKTLEKVGVKKIKTVGEKLDPNLHEAMMPASGEKDIILEEFEPGYTYQDETLKAAKVKVGDGS